MFWFLSPLCPWLRKNRVWRGHGGGEVLISSLNALSLSLSPSIKLNEQKTTAIPTKQDWQERVYAGAAGPEPTAEASSWAYPFHRVIHWHQSLKPFAMQNVGKFHVDGQHGACVLHDPVFVHIRCIVITGSSENTQKEVFTICIFSHLEKYLKLKTAK